jgi:hypothetical protein
MEVLKKWFCHPAIAQNTAKKKHNNTSITLQMPSIGYF